MAIRKRPTTVVLAATACVLLTAACGSAVPPSQYINAQNALGGGNGGGNGGNAPNTTALGA